MIAADAVAPAAQAMRDRGWRGVRRVALVVQMSGAALDPFAVDAARTELCERLHAIAAAGAPIPVACVSEADAATAAGAEVALIAVQAAIEPQPGGARLLFTMRRTAQAGAEPMPILFGVAPRSVRWGAAAADRAAIDSALEEALQQILPWKRGGASGTTSRSQGK